MRTTFDNRGGLVATRGRGTCALLAAVCVLMLIAGCANHSSPADTSELRAARLQVSGLESLLVGIDLPVDPEPSTDATNGVFIAMIDGVEATPTPALSIDVLTDRRGYRNASNTANRSVHPQRVALLDDAVLAVPGAMSEYRIVTPAAFVAGWASGRTARGTAYYIRLYRGRVGAAWPLNAPRSLP